MREELLKKLKEMPVFDSHEHLLHERDMLKKETDVIDFMTPYVCDNLMSCGLSEKVWQEANDKRKPFGERFALIGKYIPYIQNTTYFKSMLRGLKECCGMKEFTLSECERVNELLKKGVDTEALFREHNIRRAMTFVGYYGIEYFSDSKVLVPVPTVSYMAPKSEEEIRILEKESGEKVTGLDGLKRAIGAMFAVYRKCGLKNIKIGSAYNRTLDYDVPDTDRAEEQLLRVQRGEFSEVRLYGQNNRNLPMAGLKDLDNFVIWECAGQARKAGMNIIFHTGIHAWNRNDPEACHAKYLRKFIDAHADQKIVLLHLGYPFTAESLLLSKYYPNVYLDFAWLHILDRRETVRTIKKVIELLPTNKIVAFGGDVCTPVNSVGNLEISLENMVQAFSGLIGEGELTAAEAEEICRAWLHENPMKIYEVKA